VKLPSSLLVTVPVFSKLKTNVKAGIRHEEACFEFFYPRDQRDLKLLLNAGNRLPRPSAENVRTR
jgi:hypothetical protein